MSLLKARSRLKTVKSLNSILSALQVVTVVRLKRVREKHGTAGVYLQPIKRVLAGRVKAAALKQKVLVIITGNRGLCGNFNSQVIAKAAGFIKDQPGLSYVAVGKRGLQYLGRSPAALSRVIFSEHEIIERPNYAKAAALWAKLAALNTEIYVAYNSYQSAMAQAPKIYKLYPVPEELTSAKEPADYILEPNPEAVTAAFFHQFLAGRLFQIILDSQMGELAARMMVLKSGVDNSKELSEELVIAINKMRQANITRDLAEIIGSAEALRRTR